MPRVVEGRWGAGGAPSARPQAVPAHAASPAAPSDAVTSYEVADAVACTAPSLAPPALRGVVVEDGGQPLLHVCQGHALARLRGTEEQIDGQG